MKQSNRVFKSIEYDYIDLGNFFLLCGSLIHKSRAFELDEMKEKKKRFHQSRNTKWIYYDKPFEIHNDCILKSQL